jgi:hypothetical protein
MEQVRASQLVWDKTIYSRPRIRKANVESLRMAIRAEQSIPPIVVEKRTNRIVDGIHRWQAWRQEKGDDVMLEVDFREYADENALWADSVKLNSGRGIQRTRTETQWVVVKSKERGIKLEEIAGLLFLPPREITRRGLRGMSTIHRHEANTRLVQQLRRIIKIVKSHKVDFRDQLVAEPAAELQGLLQKNLSAAGKEAA